MLLTATVAMGKDIKTLVVTTKPQMHCENCENKIKGNLRFEKGVKRIETSIDEQRVTIDYDADKTTPEKIIACFGKFGYTATMIPSVYDFTVKDDVGQQVPLSNYKGQVLLIVNTATRCGFTPQYKELVALYEKYRGDGFEILDFPCNQFGEQAPGTIQEIKQFCEANFDVNFQQFDKVDVNGPGEEPLFAYLKTQKGFGGFDLSDPIGKRLDEVFRQQDPAYDQSPSIKWNFTKFLIARDGHVLKRYEPTHKMADIEADVKAALQSK